MNSAELRSSIIEARRSPYTQQVQVLKHTLMANEPVWSLLQALPDDCWIGAGAVIQNVWNCVEQKPWNTGVKDVDILYFDASDLSKESESARLRTFEALAQEFELDVVNTARIHTWYEEVFGLRIEPYTSVAHSVSSWPTLCAAVAVNVARGEFNVIAPFGFHDLFCGVVRPNKLLISEQVYRAKATRWKQTWPSLTVVDWHSESISFFG